MIQVCSEEGDLGGQSCPKIPRVFEVIRTAPEKFPGFFSTYLQLRTVRMGSRVSVVEKRLDETNESLRMVDRVRDKLLQNSVDVKALNQKVADLSGLLGVEDRFKDFVDVMKVRASITTQVTYTIQGTHKV